MDDLEQRLRSHLHAADSASVPSVDAVLSAAERSTARTVRRRRAVSSGIAVVLVTVAAGGIWRAASDGRTESADTAAPATSGTVSSTAPEPTVTTEVVSATPAVGTEPPSTTTEPATQTSSWTFLPPDPRGPTAQPAVVWTGTEAIAFGGIAPDGSRRATSAAFDVAARTWRTVADAPDGFTPDDEHIAVWTGTRALVVGPSGAFAYDPAADRWDELPDAPFAPSTDMPWAWNGGELWVWGDVPVVYDLRGEWRTLPDPPIAGPRLRAASVWSGKEWIIWGGVDLTWTDLADGAAYDPATNSWRMLPAAPLSARRVRGAWTGSEMILFGGSSFGAPGTGNGEFAHADGAAYVPATDTWRRLADGPAHPGHVPVWTGSELVLFAKGFATVYDPATDTWRDPCCEGEGLAGATPVRVGESIVLLGSFDPEIGGAVFEP